MADENQRSEVYVGIFLLAGLVLLGTLIFQFGRFGDRFHNYYPLTLIVDDAAGIIKGSEIRMGGAKIGRVSALPALTDDAHVQIDLAIDDRIKIPKNSSLSVTSASLLGDKMIIVTPPVDKVAGYIESGTLITGSGPSGLDAIQNNAEILSRDARKLMEGAGTTLKKVDLAIDDIRKASTNLSQTLEKVNTSILAKQNLDQVDQAIANFTQTSERWKKASDALEPTIGDARTAIQSIQKAATGAEQTFAKVNDRMEELKPAFKDIPNATKAITRAAEKASATMDKVDQGKGLLGTLTNDDDVSGDAKAFIRNLREKGILRYRDGDQIHPEDDPRNRYRGIRR